MSPSRVWSLVAVLLVSAFVLTQCHDENSKNIEDGLHRRLQDVGHQPRDWGADQAFIPKMLSYVFRVLNVKGAVNDVKYGKTTSGTCSTCKFAVGMLKSFLETGKSEEEIAKYIVNVCEMLNIFTPRVCQGVVRVFKDQVLYVLARATLESDEICGILLGRTCADVINPFHNWTVPLPNTPKPPVVPVPRPKAGSPVLKVLHLTDIHLDPHYEEGMNNQCNEPLCCRSGDGTSPVSGDKKAGKWGDYHDCDTPMATLENMLDYIVANHKIDYVVWTGDVPPHDIWNSSREENLQIIEDVNNLLKSKFKDVKVYPSIGNHETVPVNSFPPPEVKGKFDISWLYNKLVDTWGVWLPKSAEKTLQRGGFYSVKVENGFRIIAINSNYCNSMNWWLLLNSTDPADQLAWLVSELEKAELAGEKVHIISHIPPGKYDCVKVWSQNFYRIINRFESTVMAQFYGHTHFDEFELFYDEEEATTTTTTTTTTKRRATNVAYISPSVTTFGGVNPSYRIFTVDGNYPGSTRAILDHETYFMNLTLANSKPECVPEWSRAYSAKELYRMDSLQPEEWSKVVDSFQEDDLLFQTFYEMYAMRSSFEKSICEGGCKADLICDLKSARSNDPSLCLE